MIKECPESVSGHDEGSRRDGCCTWCGKKFKGSAPKADQYPVSDLTDAYGEYYDPDWNGNGNHLQA